MCVRTQGWQTRLPDLCEAIFKQPSAFGEHDQQKLQLEIAEEALMTADQAARIARKGHRLCAQAGQMLEALYERGRRALDRSDKVNRALTNG